MRREPRRRLGQRPGAVAVDGEEVAPPRGLDQPGEMEHGIGALDQALERADIVERAGHHLRRRQVAPAGHVGLAPEQQPHPPAGAQQFGDEVPADEAAGAGHRRQRRVRPRFGIRPRRNHWSGRRQPVAPEGVGRLG